MKVGVNEDVIVGPGDAVAVGVGSFTATVTVPGALSRLPLLAI